MRHTNGYEESLRWVRYAKGEISKEEYEGGTEQKYSAASILNRRRAIRSRYQTMGEKKYREIRLK